MRREWYSIGIHLGYMYEGSPIIVPDGTPQPEDRVSSYEQTARPGSRAPHIWLSEGRSIIDEFGKEFVLLRFGAPAAEGQEIARAAAQRGMPFRVVDIGDRAAADLYAARLVLVRPDGQVAWRGNAAPADAAELIARVSGDMAAAPLKGHREKVA
jgi:hypothetical protein